MKRSHKIIVAMITAILTVIIVVYAVAEGKSQHEQYAVITKGEVSETITPWFNRDSGAYYYFLPSFISKEDFLAEQIKSNGIAHSGDTTLSIRYKQKEYPLHILQSQNITTMFLSTGAEELQKTQSFKGYTCAASMRLVDPEGKVEYSDSLMQTQLRCRGNSTFDKEKKAYQINLSSSESLMHLSPSKKWILLANAFDGSNIRNKIIYDLAAQIFSGWSPRCQYVDLYLNGSYQGLYLLTEKIEVSDSRLQIPGSRKYLFTMMSDLQEEEDAIIFSFPKTQRKAELIYPKAVTIEEKYEIQDRLHQLEALILNGQADPTIDLSQSIDLDSWGQRYLIDEIFENGDCGYVSSYFYYSPDGASRLVYGGPIWDYDLTIGIHRGIANPRILLGLEPPLEPNLTTFYIALMHNQGYQSRVKNIYRQQFRDRLQDIIDNRIDALADSIGPAASMNNLRWRGMFQKSTDFPYVDSVMTPGFLKQYLAHRVDFLDSVWIHDIPIRNVKIQTGASQIEQYSITSATTIRQLIGLDNHDLDHVIWEDRYTNKQFRIDSSVDSDACMAIVSPDSLLWHEDEDVAPEVNWSKKNILRALMMPAMLMVIVLFVFVDNKRNSSKKHE